MIRTKFFFPFMVILAASLNVAYFVGVLDRALHEDIALLVAALVANLIAISPWLRVRNGTESIGQAANVVAVVQLLMVGVAWIFRLLGTDGHIDARLEAEAASLAAGALLASIVPVAVLLVTALASQR